MKTPKGRSYRAQMEGLYRFLTAEDEPSAITTEDRRAFLEAHGMNVQRQIDWVHDRLAAARAEERLAAAQENREREVARFQQSRKERATPSMVAQVRERIRALLDTLSARNPQMVGFFRRFEEATEADLESLLSDLNFLLELENDGRSPLDR